LAFSTNSIAFSCSVIIIIPSGNNPRQPDQDQKLDPSCIETTILAEVFFRNEEAAEFANIIDESPKLKRLFQLIQKAHLVKNICLVFIWFSFFDQQESWCKKALAETKFHGDDFNCSQDMQGQRYYSFPKILDSTGIWVNIVVYFSMIFVGLEQIMVLFLKTSFRIRLRCFSIVAFTFLTIIFNLLYLTNV